MSHPELLILGALRALVEVAMLFLIGQGLLALLAGSRRHTNTIYKVFVIDDPQHVFQSQGGFASLKVDDEAHANPCRERQLGLCQRELPASGTQCTP
jgi:hypothetical protein